MKKMLAVARIAVFGVLSIFLFCTVGIITGLMDDDTSTQFVMPGLTVGYSIEYIHPMRVVLVIGACFLAILWPFIYASNRVQYNSWLNIKRLAIVSVLYLLFGVGAYFLIPSMSMHYYDFRAGILEKKGKATWRNQPVGEWTYWWQNGQINEQGSFVYRPKQKCSSRNGEWKQWDRSGTLCGEATYSFIIRFYNDSFTGRPGVFTGGEISSGYWADFSDGKISFIIAHWPQEGVVNVNYDEYHKDFIVERPEDVAGAIAAAKKEVQIHMKK